MKRRLFPILSAASLALAISAMGLWIVSYWYGQHVAYTYRPGAPWAVRDYQLDSAAGSLEFRYAVGWLTASYEPGWKSFSYKPDDNAFAWPKGWWFAYESYDGGSSVHDYTLAVPYWLLTSLFLIFPACWLRRFRRRQRLGLCLNCGYDLRATPERCPECGRVPSKPTAM